MLFHGTTESAVELIQQQGIIPPEQSDTGATENRSIIETLDSVRPEEFPKRSASVFCVANIQPLHSYDTIVKIDETRIPKSLPRYIGHRGIADEISFAIESNEWGMNTGSDPEESARKYWKHARLVDEVIPDNVRVQEEVVFGGKIPPEAVTEIV